MTRRIFFFVLLCCGALAVSGMSASAHPHGSGAPTTIVAERHSDANGGNGEIVSVRPDGSHLRVLTTGNEDEVPDLSHDGRLVAFERCIDAVGCDQEGAKNIFVMRRNGSNVRQLTHCVPGSDCLGSFDPAFSPDDRQIAFTRDQLDASGVNFQGIFLMRADGTHLRRVTSNGPDNLPDSSPRFSPDGRRLVFTRELPGDVQQLMTVNIDGTHPRLLLPQVNAFAPDWSPDGRHIAYSWVRPAADGSVLDVARVRVNGDDVRPLTDTAGTGTFAFQPDYSPDGSRVVLSRSDDQGCTLMTVSAYGGALHPVPTGGGCTVNPSWSGGRSAHHD